jgi:NAD(P)-dependent dehydrogenase (short-subunit alcohol dehydrogenase family)
MTDLAGRTAIVTGGASGIGAATVAALARAGARVVAVDLSFGEAVGTRADGVVTMRADVTSEADCAAVVAEAMRSGRIDILVNSAGIARDIPFEDTSREVFDRIMAVNVGGLFQLSRDAAREMIRRRSGAIVHVASVSGLVGSKGRVAYGGSKGAVVHMTRCMATDLGRHGIRVNAVAPGPVDTPMVKAIYTPADYAAYNARIPLARFAEPAEIADAVLFLASDRASFITGQTLAVDGGFSSAGIMPDG